MKKLVYSAVVAATLVVSELSALKLTITNDTEESFQVRTCNESTMHTIKDEKAKKLADRQYIASDLGGAYSCVLIKRKGDSNDYTWKIGANGPASEAKFNYSKLLKGKQGNKVWVEKFIQYKTLDLLDY